MAYREHRVLLCDEVHVSIVKSACGPLQRAGEGGLSRWRLRENLTQYIHLLAVTKINGRGAYQEHVNNSLHAHGRDIIDQEEISCADNISGGQQTERGRKIEIQRER